MPNLCLAGDNAGLHRFLAGNLLAGCLDDRAFDRLNQSVATRKGKVSLGCLDNFSIGKHTSSRIGIACFRRSRAHRSDLRPRGAANGSGFPIFTALIARLRWKP